MELGTPRAHRDAVYTADKMELSATWCQEAMSSILDVTTTMIRICTKSKRSWNPDAKEYRHALR